MSELKTGIKTEISAELRGLSQMPFDQPTRNRLARFVGEARSLLTEEFTRQLQNEYGMDPVKRWGHGDREAHSSE